MKDVVGVVLGKKRNHAIMSSPKKESHKEVYKVTDQLFRIFDKNKRAGAKALIVI